MAEAPSANPFGEMTEETEYRSVEPVAIAGLALGLLSPIALAGSLLWLFPPLGILINAIALKRIRSNPARTGRAMAIVGLALSVIFSVAPPVETATTRTLLARQGRPVADQWFEYLRERSPEKALLLQFEPDRRPPLSEDVWFFYRQEKDSSKRLSRFVEIPLVKTLLALGTGADVRFYKTFAADSDKSMGQAAYLYTVTYHDDQGKKKTFLVNILLERNPTRSTTQSPWRVRDATVPPAESDRAPRRQSQAMSASITRP